MLLRLRGGLFRGCIELGKLLLLLPIRIGGSLRSFWEYCRDIIGELGFAETIDPENITGELIEDII